MPQSDANHTQRIADVREAVQNAQGRLVGFTDTAPNVRYIRALQARLAADLEHLAEHEAAEIMGADCPRDAEDPAALRVYRRHTDRIARLLGLAQGATDGEM